VSHDGARYCVGNKVSFLSQDIVEFLNQTSRASLGDWLAENPIMRNFVTSPYISIRPTAIPAAQRITAHENELGRYVHLYYRDGSHRYIFDISNWNQTVEDIESLIIDVDLAGGNCHVERSFLILLVPIGYVLQTSRPPSNPAFRLHQSVNSQTGLR